MKERNSKRLRAHADFAELLHEGMKEDIVLRQYMALARKEIIGPLKLAKLFKSMKMRKLSQRRSNIYYCCDKYKVEQFNTNSVGDCLWQSFFM